MPTGYTAKLMDEGQTFEEFVLTCARAFGATIDMRDEDLDAPIPEKFEESSYHKTALKNAEEKLNSLLQMSFDKILEFGEKEKAKEVKSTQRAIKRMREENERIISMSGKVEDWTPPTKDHMELKDFMLNQLKLSLNDYTYSEESLAKMLAKTPVDFYIRSVVAIESNVEYHREAILRDANRTGKNNEWITQLRQSLK